MKISKELLSEIMQLGILEVGEVDDCYLSFNYYILDDDNIKACINIYELADKVIDWIESKCFWIKKEHKDIYQLIYQDKEVYGIDSKKRIDVPFMCAEWILKELKKC